MKYFKEPQHLETTQDVVEKAEKFTNQVIGTVNYSDSRQSNQVKVWTDHFISKIGEEAVYEVLKKYTDNVVEPDYTIYEGKAKSWDADLKVNGIDLAVKTQSKSAANRYGLSWTFQSGGFRKDPILNRPNDWVCFVLCDDTNNSYNCTIYPPIQIKELVFGEPRLAKLKGEKKVVYAKDNNFLG